MGESRFSSLKVTSLIRFGYVELRDFSIQWIPDIINVSGTTCGVSYNRTFLYAALKRNETGSWGQDTH